MLTHIDHIILCHCISLPCSFGFSTAINAYRGFSYTCDGSEAFLSNCNGTASVCVTDSVIHAVAIQCGA